MITITIKNSASGKRAVINTAHITAIHEKETGSFIEYIGPAVDNDACGITTDEEFRSVITKIEAATGTSISYV